MLRGAPKAHEVFYYRKRDFGAAIHCTKSVWKVTKGFALAEKACFPQLSYKRVIVITTNIVDSSGESWRYSRTGCW